MSTRPHFHMSTSDTCRSHVPGPPRSAGMLGAAVLSEAFHSWPQRINTNASFSVQYRQGPGLAEASTTPGLSLLAFVRHRPVACPGSRVAIHAIDTVVWMKTNELRKGILTALCGTLVGRCVAVRAFPVGLWLFESPPSVWFCERGVSAKEFRRRVGSRCRVVSRGGAEW